MVSFFSLSLAFVCVQVWAGRGELGIVIMQGATLMNLDLTDGWLTPAIPSARTVLGLHYRCVCYAQLFYVGAWG